MGTTPETYPPAKHVMRDLDITTLVVSLNRSIGVIPLSDALRSGVSPGRVAALGLTSIVADTQAAMVALIAAQPDWIATVDLSVSEVAPLVGNHMLVDARLVRAGSNIIVIRVDSYDVGDRDDIEALADEALPSVDRPACATGLVSFTRIPASASAASARLKPGERVGMVSPTAPAELELRPLLDRIGLHIVDAAAGVVELERTPYVGNSFGAVNGGVLGMIFQGAAEAAHPGMRAADIQIHYVSQAKTGPVRTRLTPVRQTSDHAVCRIEAVDAGHNDQLLAIATVVVRSPARS